MYFLLLVLSFLLGGFFFLKVFQPMITDRVNSNVAQINKKNEQSLKEERKKIEALEKQIESKVVELPKTSYSDTEFLNIESCVKKFTEIYYGMSSENVVQESEKLKDFTTKKGEKIVVPTWANDKLIPSLEQEKRTEKYYVNLNGVTGKATVMGFLFVTTKYEGGEPFTVKKLVKLDVEKNEYNEWKVSDLVDTVTTNDVAESFFK